MADIMLLGHKFQPLDNMDYDIFAGASDNALICKLESCILIANPSEKNPGYYDISEIPNPPDEEPEPTIEIVYTCQGNICG